MSYIERKSKLSSLKEEILSLISQHGHQMMLLAIESTIPNLNPTKEDSNIKEPSFQEACHYFLSCPAYLSLSSSTKKSYRSELNQYGRFLAGINSTKQITFSEGAKTEHLLDFLEPSKGSNTFMKKSAFLRTFLRCVFSHYYGKTLDQDLKDLLPVTWNRDMLPKFFSKSEIAELLALAASTNSADRNHAIIWTFLSSGIRLNELCNLQIKDILIEEQTIMVIPKRKRRDKSTNKARRKINKLGLMILTEYIDSRFNHKKMTLSHKEYNELYIFSAKQGCKPISGRTIEYMVRHLMDSALSIPLEKKQRLTVHSFRHTFAVYGLESGLDIYTLSKLLGHNSIQSTAQYLRLHDNQLKEAINKHPFAKEILFNLERRLE